MVTRLLKIPSFLIWLCVIAAAPEVRAQEPQAPVQQLDPEYRADILRLLDDTGISEAAMELSSEMAKAVVQNLQDKRASAHLETPPKWYEMTREIAEQELRKRLDEPDGFTSQMVSLYAKYFTHDDIKGIIAFYESSVGKKMLSVQTQLRTESFAVLRKWISDVKPRFGQALEERLNAQSQPPRPQ
jgi:uncharacterized protein